MENQKQRVYDALDKLKIKYEVVEHEPVHTMEDMDRLGLPEKGTLCKNLFLRDSKGKRHFLVTCEESKKVDLKSLGRQLGGGNLSFAMAMLDYTNSGFVLNSVHSREGCYLYLKRIDMGQTDGPLGNEEKEAVEQALGYVQAKDN